VLAGARIGAALWVAIAAASFHLAATRTELAGLALLFLLGLVRMAALATARQAFYAGLAAGYLCYAPPLAFLWTIFGPSALVLWGILAAWLGLFVATARAVRVRWGRWPMVLLLPWLWTGAEYFRSEVYYLRFSWLGVGTLIEPAQAVPLVGWLGVYGLGFALVAAIALADVVRPACRAVVLALLVAGLGVSGHLGRPAELGLGLRTLRVAGVQLECASLTT
jgi:hypothetical protein